MSRHVPMKGGQRLMGPQQPRPQMQTSIPAPPSSPMRRNHYLSRTQVAERIGVTPGALSRYKLPEPDAWIGDVRGWLPQTVDAWQEARPGRGARTDLKGDGKSA